MLKYTLVLYIKKTWNCHYIMSKTKYGIARVVFGTFLLEHNDLIYKTMHLKLKRKGCKYVFKLLKCKLQ